MDDHVGTKREGLDGECRGEGVVDHQADALDDVSITLVVEFEGGALVDRGGLRVPCG